MTIYRNAWDDPNCKAALRQRPASQVYVICCPLCRNYGYYNEGSHWSCSVEDCNGCYDGDDLDDILDNGEAITLEDYTDMQMTDEDGIL